MFSLVSAAVLAALFASWKIFRSPAPLVANCDVQMNSKGHFLENIGESLSVRTDVTGLAKISFADPWLQVEWSPQFDIRVGESAQKDQSDILNKLGRETAWAKISKQGDIVEIRFTPRPELTKDLQEVVLNTSKMILQQVTNVLFVDQSGSDSKWVDGNDIWGRNSRLVSRSLSPSSNSNPMIRVETKSIVPTATTMAGRGTFEITSHKLELSLTGRQVLTNQLQLGSSETDYRLQCQKTYDKPSISAPTQQALTTTPWLVFDVHARKQAALEEKLQGKTLVQLEKKAKSFRKLKKGYEGVADFSRELQDFLYLHPDSATKYYELAVHLGPSHPLFNEILKALSRVPGPASEKALLDLADRYAKDSDSTKKILIAVGMSEKPGLLTAEALEKWGADPTFSQAPLADLMLGHVAHQMHNQGTDPARALAIDRSLVTKLEVATTDPEKSHWLSALGNTGLCSNLAALKKEMHAATPYVAENALMAIRFCEEPEIQELLWRVFVERPELNSTFFSAINMRSERGLPSSIVHERLLEWIKSPPANTPDDIVNRTREWAKLKNL